MRKGALAVGIICGFLCMVCVVLYASSVRNEADAARQEAMERYGGEQVDVLVATQDVYPGEVLDASNSTVKTWLADLLPQDCVNNLNAVQGKQVTSLIIAGEAVSLKRFESSSTELNVPEGCVAISVPAKDVQAVGGALSPGNIVDVYATGSQTSCLGERILVLATNVDSSELSKSSSVTWVTLAVPLDQSQEFVTASQSMDIYFTLPATASAEDGSAASNDAEDLDSGDSADESKSDAGSTASSGEAASSAVGDSDGREGSAETTNTPAS